MRVVILGLAALSSTLGQVTTGSFSGYVLDPSKRPIPNAQVTVTDRARAVVRTNTTGLSGFYNIAELPPSLYEVSASAPGFTGRVLHTAPPFSRAS